MKFGQSLLVFVLAASLATGHCQSGEVIADNHHALLPMAADDKHPQERQLQTSGTWSALGGPVYGNAASDLLGRARDISSDGTTIVGCSANKPCKVFTYNGSNYVRKGSKITQPNPNDLFGNSAVRLSSNGQRIAVGAPFADTGGFNNNGCVYVYDFDGTTWQLTVSHCGGASNAYIGWTLAMSADGNTIAGAGAANNNRAEFFKYKDGAWSKQVLTGGTSFGESVALNAAGDMLAVGEMNYNSNQGQVHTYRHDGTTWNSIGVVIGGFGIAANFGSDVPLATVGSTTTMIVGALLGNIGGSDRGAVSVYTNSGGSGWTHNQDILGTRSSEYFGQRVDLSDDGNTFVASATDRSPRYGRVYRKSGGTFSQLGVDADLTVPGAADRDFRITGDGKAVLLADTFNDDFATDAGSMWVIGVVSNPSASPSAVPSHAPSASPSAVASSSPSLAPVSSISAGGDPHFYTFRNEHYDFHGHCDLILLEASHFAQGKGLSVHIRSSPFKKIFSYISDVVIRIGDDILEVGGGGKCFFNGKSLPSLAAETIGGYKMENTRTKKGRAVYKIFLDGNQEIDIREYKNWITVYVMHPSKDFAGTIGLMGSYETGAWLSRDGKRTHHDVNEFGLDWQVRESDGLLFQTPSPHPDKCDLPIVTSPRRKRRLAESSISREVAEEACAHWTPKAMEDCIMDVMISEDVGMADGGPL